MSLSQPDTQGTQAAPRLPLVPYVFTCLIASLITGAIAWASIDSLMTTPDATQNRRIAFNVAKYGVYSLDETDTPDIQSTLRREPLYPLYLAGVFRVFVDVDNLSYSCLVEDDDCASIRLLINRASMPFYIALVWAFTAAAYWIIRRWWIVWGLLVILLLVDYFMYYVALTELPAALLLLLHAMFLYRAVLELEAGKRAYKFALISGLSLGALVLTKAIFQYWLVLLVVGGGLIILLHNRHNTAMVRSWALLVASALLVIVPWLARNVIQLGEWKVAGRDNIVLAVRMEYSFITGREYLASFAYHASPVLRRHLLPLFDEEDYRRLDRNQPDSFHWQGRNRTGLVGQRVDENDGSRTRAMISLLKQRWSQQAALTLALAWRGSFVDGEYGAMWGQRLVYPKDPRFQRPVQELRPYLMEIAGIIGIFFVPSMLGVAAYALKKRRWALLMFLMPALYSFGIHAVATHYIPRYSAPLVPIFIISLGLVIRGVVDRIRSSVHQTEGDSINDIVPD